MKIELNLIVFFYRVVDDKILEGCGNFLERLLENNAGKQALGKFLSNSQFTSILLGID